MSNKALREMYTGMVRARLLLAGQSHQARDRAALKDVACWASSLVGLTARDVTLGCRQDGVLGLIRGALETRLIADGTERLYAAAGAAMTLRGDRKTRVVMAFFDRHEVGGKGWGEGLRFAADSPLIAVILPRWKGRETERDVCREARESGVPGIAVDARDAIALYRVAQESLTRARMGGGAALIEGVTLPDHNGQDTDAVTKLAAYLRRRGVLSEDAMDRIATSYIGKLQRLASLDEKS